MAMTSYIYTSIITLKLLAAFASGEDLSCYKCELTGEGGSVSECGSKCASASHCYVSGSEDTAWTMGCLSVDDRLFARGGDTAVHSRCYNTTWGGRLCVCSTPLCNTVALARDTILTTVGRASGQPLACYHGAARDGEPLCDGAGTGRCFAYSERYFSAPGAPSSRLEHGCAAPLSTWLAGGVLDILGDVLLTDGCVALHYGPHEEHVHCACTTGDLCNAHELRGYERTAGRLRAAAAWAYHQGARQSAAPTYRRCLADSGTGAAAHGDTCTGQACYAQRVDAEFYSVWRRGCVTATGAASSLVEPGVRHFEHTDRRTSIWLCDNDDLCNRGEDELVLKRSAASGKQNKEQADMDDGERLDVMRGAMGANYISDTVTAAIRSVVSEDGDAEQQSLSRSANVTSASGKAKSTAIVTYVFGVFLLLVPRCVV